MAWGFAFISHTEQLDTSNFSPYWTANGAGSQVRVVTSKACSKAGWAKKERTQRQSALREGVRGGGLASTKAHSAAHIVAEMGEIRSPPMTVNLAEERNMSSALGNSSPRQLPIRQCSLNLNPDER